MRRPIALLAIIATAAVLCTCWLIWRPRGKPAAPASSSSTAPAPPTAGNAAAAGDSSPTLVYAHNLLLRKGSQFRIYVRWIRGQMLRTHKQINPSLDDSESFVLEIQKGVIRANIGDVSNFLNTSAPPNAPLKHISIQSDGNQLKLRGTVHKMVPLPVELVGTLSATPDGRIQFHLTKIDVLKIPVKGLLGDFHLQLSDLVPASKVPGIEITGDDIFFDTEKLLPPPHIHGQVTTVRVSGPDIEVIYGNAPTDEASLAEWHNFLRFRGGAINFGKLTMHPVDLTMIDASKDRWFDLDLVNYQAQVVNGYTRMTAQNGLEIFMPDLDAMPLKKAGNGITLEWLKNRNRSVPPDVPVKAK